MHEGQLRYMNLMTSYETKSTMHHPSPSINLNTKSALNRRIGTRQIVKRNQGPRTSS